MIKYDVKVDSLWRNRWCVRWRPRELKDMWLAHRRATADRLTTRFAVGNPHPHDGAPVVSVADDKAWLCTRRGQSCSARISCRSVCAEWKGHTPKGHKCRLHKLAQSDAAWQSIVQEINGAGIVTRWRREPEVVRDGVLCGSQ